MDSRGVGLSRFVYIHCLDSGRDSFQKLSQSVLYIFTRFKCTYYICIYVSFPHCARKEMKRVEQLLTHIRKYRAQGKGRPRKILHLNRTRDRKICRYRRHHGGLYLCVYVFVCAASAHACITVSPMRTRSVAE